MKEYSGRTGLRKWLYINEDWWLPLFFILIGFGTPILMIYLVIKWYG